jgi:hypothetical protein
MMEGLSKSPLLQENLSVPKPDENQEDIYVKDCTYIGSYNWIKGDTPTILVPGPIEFPLPFYCTDPFLNRCPTSVAKSDTSVHHTT